MAKLLQFSIKVNHQRFFIEDDKSQIGPFVAGVAVSKIGRKWALLSSALPLILGWILVATATSVAFLYSARVFWGISVGMLFTVMPIYCGEIATVNVSLLTLLSYYYK